MLDRAVAALWLVSTGDHNATASPAELANMLEAAGYPAQNRSRLRKQLTSDKRTAKASGGAFRIRITARPSLDSSLSVYTRTREVPKSDSIIPQELLEGTRGYIETVGIQINASYDSGLYDCCAVMCRRLLETLIIEAYEAAGIEDQLKDADGNYRMFAALLSQVQSGTGISLSRNGLKGLKDFKRLGDLSAHNRRYNALRTDIDRVRDDIRVASEELLHLAGLR